MRLLKLACAVGLTLASALLSASAAEPVVRILVPAYVQAAVTTLKPMIEAKAGVVLTLEPTTTDVIVARLAKGDAGDLVIASKNALAPASIQEHLELERDVAVSTVGIAVADGMKPPKLSSSEDLRKFLMETPSFAHSTAQSGRHIASVIEKLGLTKVMKPKTQTGSGLMGTRLIEGKVAAVGQQISELRLAGVTNIVPLPEEHQIHIVVAAAAVKGTGRAKDVAKVLDLLASVEAAKAYDDAGLIPLKK